MPSAAPPTAPNNSPSKANSAIFMAPDPKQRRPGVGSPPPPARFNACAAKSGCFSLIVAGFSGDQLGNVLLHHLLDQIESIDNFANPDDLAVAKREEHGDVELQDPHVAPLAEVRAKLDRDLVVFDGDERQF